MVTGGDRCSKIRVVERNGRKLQDLVCNKTPWRNKACPNTSCAPCATVPGSCRRRNLNYRVVCVLCAVKGVSSVYLGESHRTWKDRWAEHQGALDRGNNSYATVRHQAEEHPDLPPAFTFHYMGSYMSSC